MTSICFVERFIQGNTLRRLVISYDAPGHLVIGTDKHWICIYCDIWVRIKYWRKDFD